MSSSSPAMAPASMPRSILIFGALVLIMTAALAFIAPRPILDNSVQAWLPRRDAALLRYQALRSDFGNDERLLVQWVGLSAEKRYQSLVYARERLQALPQVRATVSALNVYSEAFDVLGDADLGGFSASNWENLAATFQSPLNQELTLFTPGLGIGEACIVVTLEPGPPAEREALDQLVTELRELAQQQGGELRAASQALVNLELDRASRAVDEESMPLLVGLCVVLVLVTTRSLRLSIALFLPVALGVFGTEGLLGLSGASGNLLVTVTKPLLFVLIMSGGLHLIIDFQHQRFLGLSNSAAAWAALREKASPTFTALLTTSIGFGSLATAEVIPIARFGMLAAAGLGLASLLVLVLLPSILAILGGPPREGSEGWVGTATTKTIEFSVRSPREIVLIGLALTVLGFSALPQLPVEPHAYRYFGPEHPLRRDYEAIEESGHGLASLEMVISAPEPILAPSARRRERLVNLDRWLRKLRARPEVRGRIDPMILLREAGYQSARVDAPPAEAYLNDTIQALEDGLRELRAKDGRIRISLTLSTIDAPALRDLESFATQSFNDLPLAKNGATLEFTGAYPLLLETQESLLATLQFSLIGTALLMGIVMLILFRSLSLALVAAIPNALPVAVSFGLMVLFSFPLDVGTTMTAAIALGIAVDDTIHFLHAWSRGGLKAVERSSGQAIVLTSLIIAAGFLSLTSSDFGPTRAFGVLCACSLVCALFADLILLSAALRLFLKEPEPSSDDSAPGSLTESSGSNLSAQPLLTELRGDLDEDATGMGHVRATKFPEEA